MFHTSRFPFLIAIFTCITALVSAQTTPPASTFYIDSTETQFSVNVANNSEDVSLFFTSPAYSWVGVGFGEGMKGSLMIVMYPSEDGDDVTVSPRIATGHSEPSFAKEIKLDIQPGTGIKDDMFVLKAICRNCRTWDGGKLDTESRAQPMIYAFGPGRGIRSNSVNAPLRRHSRYGRFTMDMLAATGASGIPEPSAREIGVKRVGGMKRDHDRANLAHAVLGCLVVFVFWPIHTVVSGFIRRTSIKLYFGIFIVGFLVASYGLGISTSAQFNRSKSFTTPHQILALLAIPLILAIPLFPLPRLTSALPRLARLQPPITFLTFALLLITGGLGLHLSASPTPIILTYTSLSLVLILTLLILSTLVWKCGRNRQRREGRGQEEEDEQDLVLAAYYAGKKEGESRSTTPGGIYPSGGSPNAGGIYQGRASPSSASRIYGGGTMPGPQYLMNMHPGVPVHRFDQVR